MVYSADWHDGKPGRLKAVPAWDLPLNRHPQTGVPVWFINTHNHMRYFRGHHSFGIFREETQATIPEDCEEVTRVVEKNNVALDMEPGDVLLLDNYRTLHGRETFESDEGDPYQ